VSGLLALHDIQAGPACGGEGFRARAGPEDGTHGEGVALYLVDAGEVAASVAAGALDVVLARAGVGVDGDGVGDGLDAVAVVDEGVADDAGLGAGTVEPTALEFVEGGAFFGLFEEWRGREAE